MKQTKKILVLFTLLAALTSCELFEEVPEEEEEKVVDNSTYAYSFTCPSGTKNSIPIPNRLSESCKRNWEYFARTYGCNDADNFAEANRRKAQCP